MLAVIYNGFGRYEQNDKLQKGMTIEYAGVPFWLPYKELTYLPDYSFRQPDEPEWADASEKAEGEVPMIYRTVKVSGQRLAAEFTQKQFPYTNESRGLLVIPNIPTRRTGEFIKVDAGVDIEGNRIYEDVPAIAASVEEKERAERLAYEHKELRINEYLQSKRERMANGQGALYAQGMIKVFMQELGVKDLDDLSRMTQSHMPGPAQPLDTSVLDELRKEMAILRAQITTKPVEQFPVPEPADKQTAEQFI